MRGLGAAALFAVALWAQIIDIDAANFATGFIFACAVITLIRDLTANDA